MQRERGREAGSRAAPDGDEVFMSRRTVVEGDGSVLRSREETCSGSSGPVAAGVRTRRFRRGLATWLPRERIRDNVRWPVPQYLARDDSQTTRAVSKRCTYRADAVWDNGTGIVWMNVGMHDAVLYAV